jgi:hypothetical protein
MEQSIIAGNKLIMDFLGWKHHSGDVYWFPNLYPSQEHYTGETTFNVDEARFHSSWHWLMPVIEKIESLGFTVTLQYYQCQIFDNSKKYPDSRIIDADFKDTKLENAWDGVIGFIRWYNSEQSVKESDTTKAT